MTEWDRTPLPSVANPPEIALILHPRYLAFGQPSGSYVAKWWSTRKVRQQLEDVVGEFPVLARAEWDAEGTPYRLVIEATHAVRGSKVRAFLTETSHYVIPSSEERFIELEAWLYQGEKLLNTFEATGSYQRKRHLLFLLAPWRWHISASSETMQDTFRDLFLQVTKETHAW